MRTRTFLSLLVLSLTMNAMAEVRYIQLDCWSPSHSNTSPEPSDNTGIGAGTWAEISLEETSIGTANQTRGWLFDRDEDEEIQCSIMLPGDFRPDSATIPTVHVAGYPRENQNCSSALEVQLDVSSRAYDDQEAIDDGWSSPNAASMPLDCITNGCGLGVHCAKAERLSRGQAIATANASNWDPFEYVLVRIQRDHDGDSSNVDFFVTSVMLEYPLD